MGRGSDTLMQFTGQSNSQLEQATQSSGYLMIAFLLWSSMRNTSWGQTEKQIPHPTQSSWINSSIAMNSPFLTQTPLDVTPLFHFPDAHLDLWSPLKQAHHLRWFRFAKVIGIEDHRVEG